MTPRRNQAKKKNALQVEMCVHPPKSDKEITTTDVYIGFSQYWSIATETTSQLINNQLAKL